MTFERKYGLGFKGFLASVKRYDAPLGYATDSSVDYLYNPQDESFVRRRGQSIVGDTISGGNEVTGILESAYSARCRQLIALESPSLTGGYPTHCALYGADNDVDTGYFGQVYVYDPNGSNDSQKNYILGEEYGSTTYPQAGGTLASECVWKCVPYWYESGEGGYARGVDAFQRRLMFPGGRRMVQVGNWLYPASLRALPMRWNKQFNRTTSLTTYRNRIHPQGLMPPLWPGTVAAGTAATGTDTNWTGGDTFFHSVMFQFEDGSYSMPCIPRPVSATLTAGFGLVTVDSAVSSNVYRDLAWTNIPIGPAGTIARILLRTPKQNLNATTDAITVDPTDLRICGILRNNTATTFTDTNGDDDGLIDDENIVRFDHVWPKRHRYTTIGDQRKVDAYTLPNPGAIILAPVAYSSATYELNTSDEASAIFGSTTWYARVIDGTLQLRMESGGVTSTQSITLNATTTLQQVVDTINATTTGSTADLWRAQLVPGADPNALSTTLCLTSQDVLNCTTDGTTTLTTSASFSAIPIGAKITGTNIAANTYVVSKQSATSLTMSAAATGSGTNTLTFYADTGDDSRVTTNPTGNMRAYNPALPVVLCFKRSALQGYDTPKKQDVWFTISSPGANNTGTSLAPNAFVAGNLRTEDASLGPCTGVVGLDEATAVLYARGWGVLINTRGGNTGEDFDVRIRLRNRRRGCIAYGTAVAGDNWVGFLSPEGFIAADKTDEKVLSGAIWSLKESLGVLTNEIARSIKATNADTDGFGSSESAYAHAAVLGNEIHLTFRFTGSGPNNRRIVYDFSNSVAASGLAEVLSNEGGVFGWSCPLTQRFGPMCEVVTSGVSTSFGKALRFGALEGNTGTSNGRIDQFDTGMTDNGTNVTALLYCATDRCDSLRKKGFERLIPVYRNEDNTLSLTVYGNLARSISVAISGLLGTSTGGVFDREVIPLGQILGTLTHDVVEVLFTDTSATSVQSKIWGAVLEGKAQDFSIN